MWTIVATNNKRKLIVGYSDDRGRVEVWAQNLRTLADECGANWLRYDVYSQMEASDIVKAYYAAYGARA